MKKCPSCGQSVAPDAKACPKCGKPNPGGSGGSGLGCLMGLLGAAAGAGAIWALTSRRGAKDLLSECVSVARQQGQIAPPAQMPDIKNPELKTVLNMTRSGILDSLSLFCSFPPISYTDSAKRIVGSAVIDIMDDVDEMAGDLDAYLSSGAFPATETAEDKTPTASKSSDELAPIPRLKELADEANKTAIRAMSRMMSSDTISKSKLARRRVGGATIKLVARFDKLEKALQNNADLRLPPPSSPAAMPSQPPAFPVVPAASAPPLSEEARTVGRANGPFGGLVSVRVLAVLMTLHGLLAGFVGGLFVCCFVCGFVRDLQEKVQHPQSVIIWGVSCIVVSALVCVVQVAAGVMLFFRRGRTFGLIASSVGFASVVTILLVPSATILAVYGLIVLFNPRACQAFAKSDGSQPGTGRQATQLDRKAKP